LISRLTQKMVVFRFSCDKIQGDHRVGDSVTLHHPTPSGFAPTGRLVSGGFFYAAIYNSPISYVIFNLQESQISFSLPGMFHAFGVSR
jgi:hypothetical protein